MIGRSSTPPGISQEEGAPLTSDQHQKLFCSDHNPAEVFTSQMAVYHQRCQERLMSSPPTEPSRIPMDTAFFQDSSQGSNLSDSRKDSYADCKSDVKDLVSTSHSHVLDDAVTAVVKEDTVVHQDSLLTTASGEEMRGVTCRLETKELWEKFHDLGTEMIITKSGRYVGRLL